MKDLRKLEQELGMLAKEAELASRSQLRNFEEFLTQFVQVLNDAIEALQKQRLEAEKDLAEVQ